MTKSIFYKNGLKNGVSYYYEADTTIIKNFKDNLEIEIDNHAKEKKSLKDIFIKETD